MFQLLRVGDKFENIKELKRLFHYNPTLLKKKDEHGETALHWAAKRKYNKQFVLYLMKHPLCDINAKDIGNRTAMDLALKLGNQSLYFVRISLRFDLKYYKIMRNYKKELAHKLESSLNDAMLFNTLKKHKRKKKFKIPMNKIIPKADPKKA